MAETTAHSTDSPNGMVAATATHEGTVAHGGGQQHGAFPPLDARTFPSQLLWLAVFFGLLYVVLSRVILPRIGAIIEWRNHKIEGDLAEARALQQQVSAAVAQYEQALAGAKDNAQKLALEARGKLSTEIESERARVDAALAEKLAAAEAQIHITKTKAMADVSAVAVDTARAIVEHLTGMKVSAESAAKAVEGKL